MKKKITTRLGLILAALLFLSGCTKSDPLGVGSESLPGGLHISAKFNQATFTTIFSAQANPKWVYTWSARLPTDPPCLDGFDGNTPSDNQAKWFHKGKEMKPNPGPCTHKTTNHPSTVTLTIEGGSLDSEWHCSMEYEGTETGEGKKASCRYFD